MKGLAAAYVSALIFGLGLGISGMTLPTKVIGFLDVGGAWDPSLMAVMVGAILVHSISYQLITKRKSPLLAEKFQIPTRRDIDWKLILGSVAFGAGWGIGGFCPGPALVGLMSGNASVIIFVLSMVVGIYIHNFLNNKFFQQKVT